MQLPALLRKLDHYEKLLRLDKPIGTLLLLWPTLWALWLSAAGRPNWKIVWIFVIGTVLMRSAGVAVGDFADRNFDPHVARTKGRPLAAGLVTPREALILAAALALIAFILIWPLGKLVMLLSICAVSGDYLPVHQAFLPCPRPIWAWLSASASPWPTRPRPRACAAMAWILLLANIFWTMAYDTRYAMVDREDDRRIGIRTSAILFGRLDVAAVMFCHAAFLAVMLWIGWSLDLAWPLRGLFMRLFWWHINTY
jgi:4-hydroxybenzoate polyprenyltransferase